VELERAMARLNRELSAAREAEGALRAQLEELASAQTLPDEVEHLTAQVSTVSGHMRPKKRHRCSGNDFKIRLGMCLFFK